MFDLLWMVPAFPLGGFLLLALFGARLSKRAIAAAGAGSVGLSAAIALGVAAQFVLSPPPGGAFEQTLASWFHVAGLRAEFSLYLDALAAVMIVVVAFVSFWIHLYSAEYMREDASYARFFAAMNLFTASMLILVLAGGLVLLYLGWEGVGLCSYLLIGFWYGEHGNAKAAVKAFQVTRIGDAAMAVGLFLLFHEFGTLEIQPLLQRAGEQWRPDETAALLAASLLLLGAVGKSAQLPLQTWLPDAMAGPTPVSALIHAATMVTAGVYLIARTNTLFALAPPVQFAVGLIGAVTLLLAACSALVQRDIKRVLAYSTMSQIGYMFVALGVGAWHAAVFHLMTHAFFKALLFLGAGAVSEALHHERDIFRMGGLRRQMPFVFWTFVIGASALAGLPLITAGFFSKEAILSSAWFGDPAGVWLGAAGLAGSLLTAVYAFRLVFRVFFGEAQHEIAHEPGRLMLAPLAVLAFFSVVSGYVQTGPLGHVSLFSGFLASALPPFEAAGAHLAAEALLLVVAVAASLGGVYLAYVLFLQRREIPAAWAERPTVRAVQQFWAEGWSFDRLYSRAFAVPVTALARANRDDVIDGVYRFIAWGHCELHGALRGTQSGRLGWYAAGLGAGAVLLLAFTALS